LATAFSEVQQPCDAGVETATALAKPSDPMQLSSTRMGEMIKIIVLRLDLRYQPSEDLSQ